MQRERTSLSTSKNYSKLRNESPMNKLSDAERQLVNTILEKHRRRGMENNHSDQQLPNKTSVNRSSEKNDLSLEKNKANDYYQDNNSRSYSKDFPKNYNSKYLNPQYPEKMPNSGKSQNKDNNSPEYESNVIKIGTVSSNNNRVNFNYDNEKYNNLKNEKAFFNPIQDFTKKFDYSQNYTSIQEKLPPAKLNKVESKNDISNTKKQAMPPKAHFPEKNVPKKPSDLHISLEKHSFENDKESPTNLKKLKSWSPNSSVNSKQSSGTKVSKNYSHENRKGGVSSPIELFLPPEANESKDDIQVENKGSVVYMNSKSRGDSNTLEISSEYNSLNRSFNMNNNKEINTNNKFVPPIKNFESHVLNPYHNPKYNPSNEKQYDPKFNAKTPGSVVNTPNAFSIQNQNKNSKDQNNYRIEETPSMGMSEDYDTYTKNVNY